MTNCAVCNQPAQHVAITTPVYHPDQRDDYGYPILLRANYTHLCPQHASLTTLQLSDAIGLHAEGNRIEP